MIMGRLARMMAGRNGGGKGGKSADWSGASAYGAQAGKGMGMGMGMGMAGGKGMHPAFVAMEQFIEMNSLDEKCAEFLRMQSPPCIMAVISQGPPAGKNPSAMITRRVNNFMKGS